MSGLASPRVLGEVQVDVATPEKQVQREAIGEAMLADDGESEALVPPRASHTRRRPEDRNELLGHVASVTVAVAVSLVASILG